MAMATDGKIRLGLDIGGSKITAVILNGQGAETARRRIDRSGGNYANFKNEIINLIEDIENKSNLKAGRIGVALPGTVTSAGEIKVLVNLPQLVGRPLVTDLSTATGRPVKLANDADCFALSEARDGVAAGTDGTVAGLILGTGVGAGFVHEGKLMAGPNGLAGEWGHTPMPPLDDGNPPRRCPCGRLGCLEAYLSGPALSALHLEMTGEDKTAKQIAACSDDSARQTLDVYGDRLARALAGLVHTLDPAVIVLGGGLSNIDMLYNLVPTRVSRYTLTPDVAIDLRRAHFGDDSGVRGAAWL